VPSELDEPRGGLRAHPVPGSVVHPDAVAPRRGNHPRMAYVEHRRKGPPFAFETATVGDAMSHGVISCPPETPLRVVARMMATHGVHAIFVFEYTEEGDAPRLWAVVSDLDLVAATRLDLDTLTAGATAVTPLVSVAADSSIGEAGSLMAQYGIAHLAVIEPGSRHPIGVISTLDIAREIAAGLGPRETFASA
jgi:CBS domain-containing protein